MRRRNRLERWLSEFVPVLWLSEFVLSSLFASSLFASEFVRCLAVSEISSGRMIIGWVRPLSVREIAGKDADGLLEWITRPPVVSSEAA